jgi:antitoxin ParD1/3/4
LDSTGDFGTPSEFIRSLIRQDKEQRRARLDADLLEALQTKEIAVAPEELKGRSLASVLREKLARS